MTQSVLYDVQGPRARRRVMIASVIGVLVLLAVVAVAALRLADNGQFEPDKYEPFLTEPQLYERLLEGLKNTLKAAAYALVLALVLGVLLAFGRLSHRVWISVPAVAVIEFFRGVPLLLLILFVFLGFGNDIGRFWSLVGALVLYNGSVLAEVFRAGILAVPHGQSEAAYAVGLRKGQVMRLVLLPQAVRIMLPAIISQSVVALKDTSLGYVLPYEELTKTGQAIAQEFNNYLATALVLAAMFIVVNYSLSRLAVWAERRMSRAGVAPVRAREGELMGGGV